jgi:flagellar basal-body rod modification protein FlgD
MVNDVTGRAGNGTTTTIEALRKQENQASSVGKGEKRQDVVQKEDFLNILVTQLKNQDPLNPMENDQFAVDLAQFSQLEQLINLNEKFDQSANGGDVSSLAQYLGHQVALKDSMLKLGKEDADSIEVDMDKSGEVVLSILDKNEEVISNVSLGYHEAGRHVFDMDGKTPLNGDYAFKVGVKDSSGESVAADSYVLGQVTGFVPGPDGKLLIGDKEVQVNQIAIVRNS